MDTVKVVRIYFKEGEKARDHRNLMQELFSLLHEKHRVRGATLFRGIAGFGEHGLVEADDLLRLNVHLPLVLEVVDTPEKIEGIMPALRAMVPPSHIIYWEAQIETPLEE